MHQHDEVLAAIDAYCRGVYHGDIGLLRSVFDPRAQLFAEVRGQAYFRPLDDYLAVVAGRASPASLGQAFAMKPLHIEITGEIAFAKVHCPMFDFHYIDYLSFVRQEGQWKIVNKTFTDVPVAQDRPAPLT
ncbi:nuclear transport factor 2 family protein [Massilia sp. Dwa41.01b]|uniref:nuclear transport factor 2 family protein n=1 Tax=unclassified Massilia TaxID=2609279 RepID=UPI00160431FE|nr:MULTISPECIES: nuclear transport factor 2 family protein [unclassified Massilia]QNA87839.1 nuclear transport factor 2 family protein [Massilia sp. Dwa41.01b]QNA98741.1 nuclear transport factor 2 family protein [Massilia sp. Se16.2.3]